MMRKSLLCGAACVAFATSARATVLFTDTFSYPDGPLDNSSTNTASPWTESSRPTGQIQVTSGKVNLSSANTEAVGAAFSGAAVTTGTVYAGFDVNFSVLPTTTASNDIFTAFRSTPTGLSARGRISAAPASDSATQFQLGVADNSSLLSAATLYPMDLSLNTTYHVIEALNVSTGRTTLYVNSATETGGVTSADGTASSLSPIDAFSLLDGAGMGTMQFDNLTVATTFAEVAAVPEPMSLGIVGIAGLAMMRRRRA